MAKVLVKIQYQGKRGKKGLRQEERGMENGAGMMSCPPLSQPLGEVFWEYSFGGIFFLFPPVILRHSHQPAIILKTQVCK